MRILHTADWHIGRTLGQYSLLEDQKYMLRQLMALLTAQGVELLIIAGDIYDRAVPSAEAVQLVDDVLCAIAGDMGIPVAIVAGNHDSPNRLAFASRLVEKSGLYVAGTHAGGPIRSIRLTDVYGPVSLYLLPYFQPAELRGAYPGCRTASDLFAALINETRSMLMESERNLLVAHGFFADLSRTSDPLAMTSDSELSVGASDIMDISPALCFDYIALGHLHRHQTLLGGRAAYSGSPLKYAVSDALRQKTFSLVDLGPEGVAEAIAVPVLPLREVRELTGSFDRLLEAAGGQVSDDYVYANIISEGPVPYAMERLRTVYPRMVGLQFVTRDFQPSSLPVLEDAARLKPIDELFCDFYADVTGSDLSEASLALVQDMAREREEAMR